MNGQRTADASSAPVAPTPFRGGLSFHAAISLPPKGLKRVQTLFDVGVMKPGLRLSLRVNEADQLELTTQPVHGNAVTSAFSGIYEGYEEEKHVHVGAQIRQVGAQFEQHVYFQGDELGSSIAFGDIGNEISGALSIGHDLDGANHVGRFFVLRVTLWPAFFDAAGVAEVWEMIQREHGQTLSRHRAVKS